MNQIITFVKRIFFISTIAVFTLFFICGCKDEKPDNNFENGFEYVDLGLSVNWATYNVGATAPEDYGNYYAWGETTPKSNYSWDTYILKNGGDEVSNITFTKYNTSKQHGVVDNIGILAAQDDIANIKLGGSWRMPSQAECVELINNCTWEFTSLNGVDGFLGTSKKEGYTDRTIFLPAAGCRVNTDLEYVGSVGAYWTASLDTQNPIDALYIFFSGAGATTDKLVRGAGMPVRAVCPSEKKRSSETNGSNIKIGDRRTFAYYEADNPVSIIGSVIVDETGPTTITETFYNIELRNLQLFCKTIDNNDKITCCIKYRFNYYHSYFDGKYHKSDYALLRDGNIFYNDRTHINPIGFSFCSINKGIPTDIKIKSDVIIKYIKYIDENTLEVVFQDYNYNGDALSIIFRKKGKTHKKLYKL